MFVLVLLQVVLFDESGRYGCSGFCLKEEKQINVTVEKHPFTTSAFMFFELMLEVSLE